MPVVVSLVTDGSGRLLSGEPIENAAAALEPLALDALGINCVPTRRLGDDLARLAAAAPGRPLAAYGNLGVPADGPGWRFAEEIPPEDYGRETELWLELGARIIGGCCGTTPAHTRALASLKNRHPSPRGRGGRGEGS